MYLVTLLLTKPNVLKYFFFYLYIFFIEIKEFDFW